MTDQPSAKPRKSQLPKDQTLLNETTAPDASEAPASGAQETIQTSLTTVPEQQMYAMAELFSQQLARHMSHNISVALEPLSAAVINSSAQVTALTETIQAAMNPNREEEAPPPAPVFPDSEMIHGEGMPWHLAGGPLS